MYARMYVRKLLVTVLEISTLNLVHIIPVNLGKEMRFFFLEFKILKGIFAPEKSPEGMTEPDFRFLFEVLRKKCVYLKSRETR